MTTDGNTKTGGMISGSMLAIDAKDMHYKELNKIIRESILSGVKNILLENVNGQYYIGDGIKGDDITITVNGVPGNDLGVFMDGPSIIVNNNVQDNIGNTMNAGKITVNGDAGDVIGYGMRGGRIYIRGNAGYRIGIHMKGYNEQIPVIIIGGKVGSFFGEYMAGGVMVLLSLDNSEESVGEYFGVGMHGGAIYMKQKIDFSKYSKEVEFLEANDSDMSFLKKYLSEYAKDFNLSSEDLIKGPFYKIIPSSARPYAHLYTSAAF
jgi:glutamate synthase domain-containing protein 3